MAEAAEKLVLTQAHWQALARQVQADLPNETCGFLAGRAGVVEQVWPVPSARPSPVEYEMEPEAQIRAMLAIEAAGLELTAIYHSHPAGPARPSPTDIAQAYYPETMYVIISPDGRGGWQARAFWIAAGQTQEAGLEIV